MMWLIMMVLNWINSMFTIQERRVKAQMRLEEKKKDVG